MLRIEMSEYGSPDVLKPVEMEPEDPGPGEVRVAVLAAGVNRADLFIRSGEWKQSGAFPYVPGLELVGTVEAVGAHTRFEVGDRVITMMQRLGGIHGIRAGGYQSRAVVPGNTLALLPRSISRQEAAMLGLPAVTAFMALERLDVRAGQRILVQAGSSAVGQMAIRLARAAGLEVMATGTRPSKFAAIREAGADEVVDTTDAKWFRLREPVDHVLELVGQATFAGSIALLKPGGRLLVAGATSGAKLELAAWDLMKPRTLLGYSSETLTTSELQIAVDGLSRFVERGLVVLPDPNTYPLEQAADAHRAMEAGELTGRVLLMP